MKSASSLLDQRTGRHQEQAHKVIYSSMAAAPTEQPEMTELAPNPLRDCVAPVAVAAQLHSATSFMQAEAEPSSREQHPIEKPASSQEVQTSTSTPEATTASMYPVTSARSNGDGTVRGANNSTDSVPKLGDVNTDIAAEPQAHPDASASTTDVPFTTPTKQDGVITTMTSSNPMERESQEKGDQVTLELLLLSGSRKRFIFKTSATVNEVLAWTFKDWPSEWEEQKPRDLAQLRLLYRGQFLDGSTKLSSHVAEDSSVTVMHLTIRPAEASEPTKAKRVKTADKKAPPTANTDTHGSGCCSSCIIS